MRRVHAIMTVVTVSLTMGLAGCIDPGRRDRVENWLDEAQNEWLRRARVAEDKIVGLEAGMTINEVINALAPSEPMLSSAPILVYTGSRGEMYCLFFSQEFSQDSGRLDKVVRFASESSPEGIYLLPKDKRGQPFSVPSIEGDNKEPRALGQ